MSRINRGQYEQDNGGIDELIANRLLELSMKAVGYTHEDPYTLEVEDRLLEVSQRIEQLHLEYFEAHRNALQTGNGNIDEIDLPEEIDPKLLELFLALEGIIDPDGLVTAHIIKVEGDISSDMGTPDSVDTLGFFPSE